MPQPFPPDFRTQDVETDGAIIHVRIGGHGPAVVMVHGFADTGDMWGPLAAELEMDHTVLVPDLRGMGLSSHPAGGYDKKTQAVDITRVLDSLNIQKADFVTHDIGNRLRVRRTISGSCHEMGRHGCSPSRHWTLGRDHSQPSPVALQFPWARRRTSGRGAGAHLSRPVLERIVGQSEIDRRRDAPTLRQALCAAWRHAFGVRAVRSLSTGRDRQQCLRGRASSRCRCSPLAPRNPSARQWRTTFASSPLT
jgi:hypothetical protein